MPSPEPQVSLNPDAMWQKLGALVASRTSHGDKTVCLERVAFWLTFILCGSQWVQGRDIPPNLASFLNVLVAAVLGQGVLSTVGFVTRKTTDASVAVATAPTAQTTADFSDLSHTYPSAQ